VFVDAWGNNDSSFHNPLNFHKLELCDNAVRREHADLMNAHISLDDKTSRLMYLFLLDFLDGVDFAILSCKDKRDRYYRTSAPSKMATYFGWTLFIGLDVFMIAYTVLFNMNASGMSQYAWCVTFSIWLLVDLLFVNTAMTLWTHVFLPSFSYAGINQVKAAVIQHLFDVNKNPVQSSFNAAKHFFVSVRLASLLTDIDSDMRTAVMSFHTEWPREKFVGQGVTPSGSNASGFLYPFVHVCASLHPVVHDILMTTILSILAGLITLLHGMAYSESPIIAFGSASVFLCLVLSIYIGGACCSKNDLSLNSEERKWENFSRCDIAKDDDKDDKDSNIEDDDNYNDDYPENSNRCTIRGTTSVASLFQLQVSTDTDFGDFDGTYEFDTSGSNYEGQNDTDTFDNSACHQHVIDIKNIDQNETALLGDDSSDNVIFDEPILSSASSLSPFERYQAMLLSARQPKAKSKRLSISRLSSAAGKTEVHKSFHRRSSLDTTRVLTKDGNKNTQEEILVDSMDKPINTNIITAAQDDNDNHDDGKTSLRVEEEISAETTRDADELIGKKPLTYSPNHRNWATCFDDDEDDDDDSDNSDRDDDDKFPEVSLRSSIRSSNMASSFQLQKESGTIVSELDGAPDSCLQPSVGASSGGNHKLQDDTKCDNEKAKADDVVIRKTSRSGRKLTSTDSSDNVVLSSAKSPSPVERYQASLLSARQSRTKPNRLSISRLSAADKTQGHKPMSRRSSLDTDRTSFDGF
jgi:hypothetical protein